MKKVILLFILFILYAIIVVNSSVISQLDINFISFLQNKLQNISLNIPIFFDCKLYSLLIVLPLFVGFIFFFRKYLLIDIVLFLSSPLVAYLLNILIKNIVQRPRPPVELQLAIQPSTFSFVSSHTLITMTLWGLVIYYLNLYCKNNTLKFLGMSFSVIWIVFVGFSRIWLGVHNPTDVFGGYFLGLILVYIYVKLIKLIGGKY